MSSPMAHADSTSGSNKASNFTFSSSTKATANGTQSPTRTSHSAQAGVGPRARQVKFAVGLPQVQWLTPSSSTTFSHRHRRHHFPSTPVSSSSGRTKTKSGARRSRPTDYSVQHQCSGSYSSYSSDDDLYDGDWSYYSDDESSFTVSSYSTNTYGTDPSGGSCSQEEGWRLPNSNQANIHRPRHGPSGNAISQKRMHQRRQGRGRRLVDGMIAAINVEDKVKHFGDDANTAATGLDQTSLHANAKVGLVHVHAASSSGTRASATYPTHSISGSSASTRIIQNIQRATLPTSRFVKKILAEAVSSVPVSSSTEPVIRRDSELDCTSSQPITDGRSNQADSFKREKNSSVLFVSSRDGDSRGAPHRAESQTFHSILKKSKYSSASTSTNVEIPSYDNGNEYESNAAVEQLKEDLTALAGETAASFSHAVTNLGAGTDDFIDKACQMGISEMPDYYSFSDDGELDCKPGHQQQKGYIKDWNRVKRRGRSRRKWRKRSSGDCENNGACLKGGKMGANVVSRESGMDKTSGGPSETRCGASASEPGGIDAEAADDQKKIDAGTHTLERLNGARPSLLRSELSNTDNMNKSQKIPVSNSGEAEATDATNTSKEPRGLSLGQAIMESASIGVHRSPTPVEPASDSQVKNENVKGDEENNTMANSAEHDTGQPISIVRSITLPTARISDAVGNIPNRDHKVQGTLVLGTSIPNGERKDHADNDELLGSTLIVDSPSHAPIWQSSSNGKRNKVSSDVTVSTIGAESPAIMVANPREFRWLKNSRDKHEHGTKMHFSPLRFLRILGDDSNPEDNKKKKYCAVASILLISTMLWIIIGAFLWRRFSTSGSSLASFDNFEEDDGLGDGAFAPIGHFSSQPVQNDFYLASQSPTLLQPTAVSNTLLPTSKVPSSAPTTPTSSPTVQSSPTSHPTKAKFAFDAALQTTSQSNEAGCIPGLEAQYENAMIDWIGQESYDFLDRFQVFDLAWRIEAAFDQDPWDEYFGKNGEYTEEVLFLYEKVRAFWELGGVRQQDPSKSYTLRGVRGSIVEEDELLSTLAFVSLFDMSFQEATEVIQDVREVISSMPEGYDNALLSFHSQYYELGPTRGVFILGDGMLEYLNHYGRGDAPFGLALENSIAQMYGQYLLHSALQYPVVDHTTPEIQNMDAVERKYRDLLAAALAGYYVAHPAGGNVSGDALCRQYFFLARSIGICDDDRHHRRRPVTSSEQIECVVTWASRIARGNTATILNPADIHRRFEKVFPEIMANYWKVCSPLTKEECEMDSSGTSQQDSAENDLLGSMVDATVAEAKAQDSSSSSPSAQRVHLFHIFVSHALTMVSMWYYSTL